MTTLREQYVTRIKAQEKELKQLRSRMLLNYDCNDCIESKLRQVSRTIDYLASNVRDRVGDMREV